MRNFENINRIVVKIGSSSLFHEKTGKLDLLKLEKLVRILVDMKNEGKKVILVSSGAISTGKNKLQLNEDEMTTPLRQACASVGQAQLIAIYQKLFAEYNSVCSQVLVTRYTFHNEYTRNNTANTLESLLSLNVVPVVNENDTVTTEEVVFGDNDCLSAYVAKLINADILVILSDIDGLYDDDPRKNKNAVLIDEVDEIDDKIINMAKKTPGTRYGSGGMSSKIEAAEIATKSDIDMVIANSSNINNLELVIKGENIGTYFKASGEDTFQFSEFGIND